jgi:hypothetical protein
MVTRALHQEFQKYLRLVKVMPQPIHYAFSCPFSTDVPMPMVDEKILFKNKS